MPRDTRQVKLGLLQVHVALVLLKGLIVKGAGGSEVDFHFFEACTSEA